MNLNWTIMVQLTELRSKIVPSQSKRLAFNGRNWQFLWCSENVFSTMYQQWRRQVSNNRSHVTLQRKNREKRTEKKIYANKKILKKKNQILGTGFSCSTFKECQMIETRAKTLTGVKGKWVSPLLLQTPRHRA